MPTFAEHPFDMDGATGPAPVNIDPMVTYIAKLFYTDIVRRAEDLGSVMMMDAAQEGNDLGLSIDEIVAFQFGAMLATMALSDLMGSSAMMNTEPWSAYIKSLMERDAG